MPAATKSTASPALAIQSVILAVFMLPPLPGLAWSPVVPLPEQTIQRSKYPASSASPLIGKGLVARLAETIVHDEKDRLLGRSARRHNHLVTATRAPA